MLKDSQISNIRSTKSFYLLEAGYECCAVDTDPRRLERILYYHLRSCRILQFGNVDPHVFDYMNLYTIHNGKIESVIDLHSYVSFRIIYTRDLKRKILNVSFDDNNNLIFRDKEGNIIPNDYHWTESVEEYVIKGKDITRFVDKEFHISEFLDYINFEYYAPWDKVVHINHFPEGLSKNDSNLLEDNEPVILDISNCELTLKKGKVYDYNIDDKPIRDQKFFKVVLPFDLLSVSKNRDLPY